MKYDKEFLNALKELWEDLKNPIANETNPYYDSKYTPLPDLLDYIKPILLKHGFVLIQKFGTPSEKFINIVTELIHQDGQIETSLLVPIEGATPQKLGQAITYGRRYSIQTILGIASDFDDDANVFEQPSSKLSKPKRTEEESQANPALIEAAKLFAEIVGIVNKKKLQAREKAKIMDRVRSNKENAEELKKILNELKGEKNETGTKTGSTTGNVDLF